MRRNRTDGDNCDKCHYWEVDKGLNGSVGYCLRYPPVFEGFFGDLNHKFPRYKNPETKAWNTCGEYKKQLNDTA